MSEWTKVVSNPLGLVAFALFLFFLYVAKAKISDGRRWLSPLFATCAAVVLVGGFWIA
jgi:hypothetical protein